MLILIAYFNNFTILILIGRHIPQAHFLKELLKLNKITIFQVIAESIEQKKSQLLDFYNILMEVNEEEGNLEGMQPTKKVKIDPTFYLIDRKIIVFAKFDEQSSLNLTLTDITQSISKPAHISEYQINETSLLRAKALGYSCAKVLDFLRKHSRNSVTYDLQSYVKQVMQTQPTTKLYLFEQKEKNYYIFEHDNDLALSPEIQELLVKKIPPQEYAFTEEEMEEQERIKKGMITRWVVADYRHNELFKKLFQKKIPVLSEKVIEKSQITNEMRGNGDLFRKKQSLHCKNIKISLKAFTKLREYQSQALKAVVHLSNNNTKVAKSGYIVLPCGAGKTLLGIAICAKIKKEALIVCSSDSGAEQWKRQIQKWTQGISREHIIILTAKTNEGFQFKVKDHHPHIFISTYSNLKAKLTIGESQEGKKQVKIQHQWMKLMPWGLIIFDEAQWLPAPGNSLIADSLMAHVKIGLTATPLREDENIKSLIYMIGPRLYQGSWRKFVESGYLANPKCLQIRTKLTPYFQLLFQKTTKEKEQEAIFECNPNKIKTLLLLLQYHESMGDQIIVFCDRISVIYYIAQRLKRPLLTGDTSIEDRNFVFDMFREGIYKTVLLSRIGDEAIDLPNATVGIEINIHKGSRRQMLQRLGRIMRPKQCNSSSSYNAMFYTIITDDTPEIRYFNKRRECLINLGFQYDLRFSDYGEDAISDIFKDDNSQTSRKAASKFGEIVSSEQDYWIRMKYGQQDFGPTSMNTESTYNPQNSFQFGNQSRQKKKIA